DRGVREQRVPARREGVQEPATGSGRAAPHVVPAAGGGGVADAGRAADVSGAVRLRQAAPVPAWGQLPAARADHAACLSARPRRACDRLRRCTGRTAGWLSAALRARATAAEPSTAERSRADWRGAAAAPASVRLAGRSPYDAATSARNTSGATMSPALSPTA